jgi:secreted protein with Ig-like and vWFA domain
MRPASIVFLFAISIGDPNLDLPVHPSMQQAQPAPLPEAPEHEVESTNDTLVYVIDVSGSMNTEQRLAKAKRETSRSIASLPPSFRFNVVTFSCVLRKLWPELRRADGAAKGEALAFVESLTASSGTGTGPGTALALSDRQVEAVALLTDGAPNCGARGVQGHRTMINTSNVQRAVINVFGIAAGGDYRTFCMNVAADSGGSYYDVP